MAAGLHAALGSQSRDRCLSFGNLWSFGMALDEFFAEAVAVHGWAWALGSSKAPRGLVITLEEV